MTFLPFPTILSTLFRVSKVGMTTTATSFASFHSDVVDQKGSGIVENSNRHGFPLIYYSRLLPWEVLVQGDLLGTLLRLVAMSLKRLLRQLDLFRQHDCS